MNGSERKLSESVEKRLKEIKGVQIFRQVRLMADRDYKAMNLLEEQNCKNG